MTVDVYAVAEQLFHRFTVSAWKAIPIVRVPIRTRTNAAAPAPSTLQTHFPTVHLRNVLPAIGAKQLPSVTSLSVG